MTASSPNATRQQVGRWALSLPVQATMYVTLCALVLWTIYFTTYPPIHDQVHSLRHHTLMVSCH